VFFGDGREELDHKKRVARSFFVHQPREGFGAYPLTTESVRDKLVHVLEREGLRTISSTITPALRIESSVSI